MNSFITWISVYNTWIQIQYEFVCYTNLYNIQIHWIFFFPCLYAVGSLTHDIAFYSSSSNTLMKLATGSKRRITSFYMQHIDNYRHPPCVPNWVFAMILSVNVFTFAIKTLTEECILIVWLFLMKIGCFGISMKKNVITQIFLIKCLNIMMCIMFG